MTAISIFLSFQSDLDSLSDTFQLLLKDEAVQNTAVHSLLRLKVTAANTAYFILRVMMKLWRVTWVCSWVWWSCKCDEMWSRSHTSTALMFWLQRKQNESDRERERDLSWQVDGGFRSIDAWGQQVSELSDPHTSGSYTPLAGAINTRYCIKRSEAPLEFQ